MNNNTDNKTLNKRVFGLIGINVDRGNWNAQFDSMPKNIGGDYYGSDKALKYAIRRLAEQQGEKILFAKRYNIGKDGKLQPLTLAERMVQLYPDISLSKKAESMPILNALFDTWDVKQFGCAFAIPDHSYSVTGAVQIYNGYNVFPDMDEQILEEDILSPFRNSNNENGEQASIGKRTFVKKAMYVYPLIINPIAYNEFIGLGATEGYTEEDYNSFKEMVKNCANNLQTNTKSGCNNSFAVYIETEPMVNIPNLDKYLEYNYVDGKDIFTLKIAHIIEKLGDKILNIEIVLEDGVEFTVEGWN